MAETCDGRHYCEPSHYPSGPGEVYVCDDCGRRHESFSVHDSGERLHLSPSILAHIPVGTWGWTGAPTP